jgi:hypothetical protein
MHMVQSKNSPSKTNFTRQYGKWFRTAKHSTPTEIEVGSFAGGLLMDFMELDCSF